MKKCNKCKMILTINLFGKDKKTKDGLRHVCRECNNSYNIEYVKKPGVIEKRKEYRRRYDVLYKERKNELTRISYSKDPKSAKAIRDKFKQNNPGRIGLISKKYRDANKCKILALINKRRAQKLNATPSWLTSEHLKEIEMFYKVAAWLNGWKMMQFHVDHIIPLQGKEVSELHVPWNLQILTAEENVRKGNAVLRSNNGSGLTGY